LALVEKRQQNDLPVREFEGVVMSVQDFLVDLTEDSSLVFDRGPTPGP